MLNVLHSILARYFRGQEFHFAVKFVYFKTCSAQNLVLFFLFWLSYPGDCGTNFALFFLVFSESADQLLHTGHASRRFSFHNKTNPGTFFYLRSVKSTWQGDHPGNKTNPGTWKGWSYYYYYYWQQDMAPSNEWSCHVCVDNKLNALQGQNIELRFFHRPK